MNYSTKATLRRLLQHTLCLLWITSLLIPMSEVKAQDSDQNPDPQAQARELLALLTPEEKVGQLFMVSFSGTSAEKQSNIYDLITTHHIGGVILSAENNNFVGPVNTLENASALINSLQSAALETLPAENADGENSQDPNVSTPLLIGLSQEGDGYPKRSNSLCIDHLAHVDVRWRFPGEQTWPKKLVL